MERLSRRTLVASLERSARLMQRWRGARLRGYIRLLGGKCGSNIRAERGVLIRHPPHRGWSIGSGCYFGTGVVIDVSSEARFAIGHSTKIMHRVSLSASDSVIIGARVQIADNATVRDNNHDVRVLGRPMIDLPTVNSGVRIGSDVWIGHGVAVLAGVTVGAGAVVGANAVVTRDVAAGSIAAGVPARLLRLRPKGEPPVAGAR